MITCWLTRREIARCVDDEQPVAATVRRHMHGCAQCDRYYQQQKALVSQLTHEAGHDVFQPSPFLRGKIVAAVRRAAESESEPTPKPRLAWASGLTLSVVAAVAIAIPLGLREPTPPPRSAELISKVIQLSGDEALEEATGQNLEGWTMTLNQPLESEIEYVMSDARSAIDSLAASFIPESLFAASSTMVR